MRRLLLTILMMFMTIPAMAAENVASQNDNWLKPVEARYVCMMNNKVFDKPQIAIEIKGKTYYGCCPMCAENLKNSAELRQGTDSVSGNKIDKASAIIGADLQGNTYYFENEDNFNKFANSPIPQIKKGNSVPNDKENKQ